MPPIDRELQKKLNDLELNLKKAHQEIEAHKKEVKKSAVSIKEKDMKISQLGLEMAALIQKNLDLANALEDVTKARPMIRVEELARQLRETVLTLNKEAKQKSMEGNEQVLVDQFEVEFKGGIDVNDGIRLVQLQPPELSPQSVSTIKFALQRVPVIKIVDDSIQNK
jgi:predicted HNH restriction endonuclease